MTERLKRASAQADASLKVETLDCKWQAFIIIGTFMQAMPDECWQIIIELGNSDDEDTRTAVARFYWNIILKKIPSFLRLGSKK